eukprot:TRINITY_DN2646_c0_g1_i5.p1 TRINITY_DN2646_c0_g1~~TRINITY_DN2646_c0_g1_i5.p1  ORF type:complete len:244 (-),score=68.20 TRINITY_DN2646_c0_g1_i5:155-886(-)
MLRKGESMFNIPFILVLSFISFLFRFVKKAEVKKEEEEGAVEENEGELSEGGAEAEVERAKQKLREKKNKEQVIFQPEEEEDPEKELDFHLAIMEMEHITTGNNTLESYNTLIDRYIKLHQKQRADNDKRADEKNNNMDMAMSVLDALHEQDITPDNVTFISLIDGFRQDNQLDRAYDLFWLAKKENKNQLEYYEFLYEDFILDYHKKGNVEKAEKIYRDMLKDGFEPDDKIVELIEPHKKQQ